VQDARKRFNTGWGGIFEPGMNQLAGSNQDYYSVNHWCDVSDQESGISLYTREACLVELGSMVDERAGKYGVKSWKTEPDTGNTIFSYAMNNYWHTNFKADQEGVTTLHYAIEPHGIMKLGETQRKAMEFTQPFFVLPATTDTSERSLFEISNPNVVATWVEAMPSGFKIRLFNAGGAPESFSLAFPSFKPAKMILFKENGKAETLIPGQKIFLPAFGIMEMGLMNN
jgi:alpha-mannosidase